MDVSALRTAASGECVDISPASSVRCTISVRRREFGRLVLSAHVVNDTEEIVICAPGNRSDSTALLQTESNLVCEPHAELGFLFAVSRLGRSRCAFVRVSGTTFACGFEAKLQEDAMRTVVTSVAVAALCVGVIAGIVLFERKRRAEAFKRVPREARAEHEVPAPIVPAASAAPLQTSFPALHGLQARGLAALLDENRAVLAALERLRQGFSATEFVAKVVNQSSERLRCSIEARTRRGAVRIGSDAFWIHPQSVASVNVAVPLRLPFRVRTLYLRMESASVNASAQADVPAPPIVRIATAAAIALGLAAIGTAVLLLARPRVVAFEVPGQILAGTAVTASYSLAGIGTGRYDVSMNGVTIARGTMPIGNGSVTFPASARPQKYLVTIGLRGPFGSAQASRSVTAVARLASLPASIGALAVDPGVAAAGAPIRVRYRAAADTGTVSLVDVTGIALRTVPYRPQGLSLLAAPPVEVPTQYQIRLDVSRAGSRASASVGFLVLPKPLATPASTPGLPSRVLAASQLLAVSPSYVLSARTFDVRLLSHPSGLHLTLQNRRGVTVAMQRVLASTSLVRFRAPYVTQDETFSIVASFRYGRSDQVVLDPIVIHAR